jgi:sugar lactone lactonase YvrE
VPDEKIYDVFLSYASPDRADVEKLALRLENEAHLKVFLDKWVLVPGEEFIPELDEAIRASRSCAVFLGPQGIRPWQSQEIQAALTRAVSVSGRSGAPAFRVIPVLLPGAPELPPEDIPTFLSLRTWIDFRCVKGLDDEDMFLRLVAGVRGMAPPKPRTAPAWLTSIKIPEFQRPTGLAVDGQAIIVADHQAGHVVRLENGKVVRSTSGLAKPHHLIVMGDTIIVADTYHHQLSFLDLDLNLRHTKAEFGDYKLKRPHGLASNYPNEFYVTDADNHRVLRLENESVASAAGRPGPRSGIEPGEFNVPCGVAASLDCIYVADTYNHRVQVLTRDLRPLSAFGRMGHGFGEFAYPVAVATWHHWIVVADEYNKRLQLWRREGQGAPFTAACISADLCGDWLGSPFGLCFDEDGWLFVADRQDGKILRIDFEKMLAERRDASTGANASAGLSTAPSA